MKILSFIVIVSTVALMSGPVAAQNDQNAKKYVLFASGDVMLARWVPIAVYEKGPKWPLEDVAHLSKDADIALTNLECVLSTKGYFYDKGESRPFLYRARPEMIDVLTEAGFDVVTVGNNHAMDYGGEAVAEQNEILEASGIAHTGAGLNVNEASEPAYIKVGDIIIGVISLETEIPLFKATQDKAGVFHAKSNSAVKKALKDLIPKVRKRSDLVVFSPHWGDNWTDNVEKSRREL